MNQKQIDAKKAELELKLKCKVQAISVTDGDDQAVGFLKNPTRQDKMRSIDGLATGSLSQTCDVLLRSCLIAEESDPRILSDEEANDPIYLGFIMAVQKLVKFYSEGVKKN